MSETGLCRQNNQDSVLALNTEHAGLFAVADGMGGHYKGELASQSAVSLLRKWWEEIQGENACPAPERTEQKAAEKRETALHPRYCPGILKKPPG